MKRPLLVFVVTCGVSFSDSVTVGDTKCEGVFVTEAPARYIISDPRDGSIRTITKEQVSDWQKSEDRDAILLRWKEARGIKAVAEKGDTESTKPAKDGAPLKKEYAPIRIEHHGDYKPDPILRDTLRERRIQQELAEQERRWLNSPEGQAEIARQNYNKQLESQSKYLKKMWQDYGIPADESMKPRITDSSGTVIRK